MSDNLNKIICVTNRKLCENPLGGKRFEISDGRTLEQVCKAIRSRGLQPVMNDYVYVG